VAAVALLTFFALPAQAQVSLSNWQGMAPAVSERYPDNPLPAPSASAQALSSPTLAQSTTVWFGGYEWVVIGWNGEGIASEASSATLLYANANSYKPDSRFRSVNWGNQYDDPADASLRSAMGRFYNTLTDPREKAIVMPRTLVGVGENIEVTFSSASSGNISTTDFSSAAGSANAGQYMGGRVLENTCTLDYYAYDRLRKSGTIGTNPYTGNYHPDKIAGWDSDSQSFWPLSVAEASLLDGSMRAYSGDWWLRSPGDFVGFAAIAIDVGYVFDSGHRVDSLASSRPAFKLNLASVIFTSSVSTNPKSALTVGAVLNPAAAIAAADAVKLTVLDAAMARPNLAITSGNGTGSINFSYTGAETGTNQVISATLIPQGSSSISHYGKLANTATSADGSFVLSLTGVATGSYTLNVFSEQANGDTETDFAGAAVSMTLTVDASGNGTIPTHAITFNLDGGAQEAGDWGSYIEGVGRDLPTTPTRNGYAFDGWYANIGLMGAPVLAISATDMGDKTFWAKWVANVYNVSYTLNGGTQVAGAWNSYTFGVGLTLPTTPTRNGYAFDGWYDNAGLTGTPVLAISATDMGDKTFWAKWLSSDAGLVNIFGQALALGGETGADTDPITANMAVANNVASIALANISAADGNATVALFSGAAFTTPQSPINLTAGASTTVYIRVTAADGVTMLYYAVTIARAANPLAGGTTASIPALGPMGLGLLVLMLAGISGIRGQRSGIRKT